MSGLLSSPIRGAIKTSITTSTDTLVAGDDFSIFVTVKNPFEVPLTLHRVSTYLPTEFLDVDQASREVEAMKLESQIEDLQTLAAEAGADVSKFPLPKRRTRRIPVIESLEISGIGLSLKTSRSTPVLARAIGTNIEGSVVSPLASIFLNLLTGKPKAGSQPSKEVIEKELVRYQEAVTELDKVEQPATVLQAGNSSTRVFTVRSKQFLFFRPSSYKLNIEVAYEIGGAMNVDTLEYVIHVRASLTSMVVGAIVGGLVGWAAKKENPFMIDVTAAGDLLTSLLIAVVSVVLLARKKDVQPLVSIEDFWGGVVTGFLVLYAGPSLFTTIVGQPAQNG